MVKGKRCVPTASLALVDNAYLEKRCRCCEKAFPPTSEFFGTETRSPNVGGLQSRCRSCQEDARKRTDAKYHDKYAKRALSTRKERYAANPEPEREYARKVVPLHRKNHPELYLYHHAKIRAKKLGLEFDLDKTDIVIPDVCPYLGIRLEIHVGVSGKKGPKQNSPSVDRIDNTLGYIKDNVEVISYRANRLKNDGTPHEIMAIGERLRRLLDERNVGAEAAQ